MATDKEINDHITEIVLRTMGIAILAVSAPLFGKEITPVSVLAGWFIFGELLLFIYKMWKS